MKVKLLKFSLPIGVLLLLLLFVFSCRKKEIFNNNHNFKLEFSADTVFFDTVFTTVGSITIPIKVFNRSNESVNISSICLGASTNSNFRINLNGLSGVNFANIKIPPKDSIFIFTEVTVNPQNSNNPVVIEDSICFLTNGNRQKIALVACGQDAYFHFPDHPKTAYLPPYSLIDGVWADDKPHVIYGLAVVDENKTLTINAGTKVYMHNDAILWVYSGGTLQVLGQKDKKVVFQSDRLEYYYKNLPGMWGKIWLSPGSINNEIDHAIIKNGRIGIHVDTLGVSANPTLLIKNTIIDNMSTACLFAQGSYVVAENCVFGDAGYYSVLLNIGGNYDFRHCAIGNLWNTSTRTTPALVLNNYYKDIKGAINIRNLKSFFGNSIIYGNNKEEIMIDKYSGSSDFDFKFENCLIKSESALDPNLFINCIKNQNPIFSDSAKCDLKENSPAINAGSATITGSIATDINGNTRILGTAPDLGAFEKK